MGFEFGESHFDGIEVGAVGRQEQQPSASAPEDGLGFFTFMGWEVIEDDDIAFSNLRSQLGLDIGVEDHTVHGSIDDKGCDEAA